jgi:site-specific recombinase XerD
MSLDTNDWNKARNTAKRLEDGTLVDPATQPRSITFAEVSTRFLAYKGPEGQNVGKDALGKYTTMLVDRMKPFCIERKTESLEEFDAADFVTECFLSFRNLNPTHNKKTETPIDKPLGDGTKEKELDRYRSFFRFCVEHGWLKHNHACKIKLVVSKPSPKYGLEPEEEPQIWDAIELVTNCGQMDQYNSRELRALVMVMRYFGLRISDAVCLDHTQLAKRESGNGYAIKVTDMQKTGD